MCRKGQLAKVVKVYIIADPNFIGDCEALRIKKDRAREDHDMSRPFNKTLGDFEVFDLIEKRLFLEPDAWQEVKMEEWRLLLEKDKAEKVQEAARRREQKKLDIESAARAKIAAVEGSVFGAKEKPVVIG